MSDEQDVRELAGKLLRSGVARTHLDAMSMAQSMIGTDMTPSGRKIDNLDAPNITVPQRPIPQKQSVDIPIHLESDMDVSKTLSEIELERSTYPKLDQNNISEVSNVSSEISAFQNQGIVPSEDVVEEELFEIESAPSINSATAGQEYNSGIIQTPPSDYFKATSQTEVLSKVEHDLEEIEEEPVHLSVYDIAPEEELSEPDLIKKEEEITSKEPLKEVEEEIYIIENQPDTVDEKQLESEEQPYTPFLEEVKKTELEEYALKKMKEQGAMDSTVDITNAETNFLDNSKETFILNSNHSKDSEDDSEDDLDITKLF